MVDMCKRICHPPVNSAPNAFTFHISYILADATKVRLDVYNEVYKSNVASLTFTILSDGNSSDISITFFWDVASSCFTE